MARIVLDTNVLIASAYNAASASRQIVDACLRGELTAIVSPSIRREYERIVRNAVRSESQRNRSDRLVFQAEVVPDVGPVRVVPEDPEDDKFFAAAVAGRAAALITNDEHVLNVGTYQGVRVMRPSSFVEGLLGDSI